MAAEHGGPPGLYPRQTVEEGEQNYLKYCSVEFDFEDFWEKNFEDVTLHDETAPAGGPIQESSARLPQSQSEVSKANVQIDTLLSDFLKDTKPGRNVYFEDQVIEKHGQEVNEKYDKESDNFAKQSGIPTQDVEKDKPEATTKTKTMSKMNVVTFDGRTILVDVCLDTTGADLRALLADRAGLDVQAFRMEAGGKPILDEDALKDHGLHGAAPRVELHARLLGGTPPPTAFTALTATQPTELANKLNELVSFLGEQQAMLVTNHNVAVEAAKAEAASNASDNYRRIENAFGDLGGVSVVDRMKELEKAYEDLDENMGKEIAFVKAASQSFAMQLNDYQSQQEAKISLLEARLNSLEPKVDGIKDETRKEMDELKASSSMFAGSASQVLTATKADITKTFEKLHQIHSEALQRSQATQEEQTRLKLQTLYTAQEEQTRVKLEALYVTLASKLENLRGGIAGLAEVQRERQQQQQHQQVQQGAAVRRVASLIMNKMRYAKI